ncbi:MAG: hypothetical protein LGR52_04995 [Candidatus Thiosymbion ectosymbiont of Robbea hypermnestra]|nr:hypothetical protein [Candidatus Thiosymbion ectosymbiont of Robbea hypermnestra]
MLHIRAEQMERLFQVPIEVADRKLCRYARARFPDHLAATPDEPLLAFVGAIRDQARRYDIVNENDVATALDLAIMYGPAFYAEPWAADIFLLTHLAGREKMALLRCRVEASGVAL